VISVKYYILCDGRGGAHRFCINRKLLVLIYTVVYVFYVTHKLYAPVDANDKHAHTCVKDKKGNDTTLIHSALRQRGVSKETGGIRALRAQYSYTTTY